MIDGAVVARQSDVADELVRPDKLVARLRQRQPVLAKRFVASFPQHHSDDVRDHLPGPNDERSGERGDRRDVAQERVLFRTPRRSDRTVDDVLRKPVDERPDLLVLQDDRTVRKRRSVARRRVIPAARAEIHRFGL